MPQAVIAQSIAIAALPTFSAQVARNEINEMRNSLTSTLQAVLILSIPAATGLVLLREPIVTLLYKGSAFTSQSVKLVSWALLWYSMGLVGHCLVEIVSRAFYAMHDTKTPVIIGVSAMTGNLLLSLFFSAVFSNLGWMPHGGLALANSTATAVESIILLTLMKRKLNGINGKKIVETVIKSISASMGMGAAILFVERLVSPYSSGRYVVISIIMGLIAYSLLLVLLRSSEIKHIFLLIRSRFAKKKL